MRSVVHPDCGDAAVDERSDLPGDDPAAVRIRLGPDLEAERADGDVGWGVVETLALGERKVRGGIGEGTRARFVVDRQPEVIDDLGPWPALFPVFVLPRYPVTGEIDLSGRRKTDEDGKCEEERDPAHPLA